MCLETVRQEYEYAPPTGDNPRPGILTLSFKKASHAQSKSLARSITLTHRPRPRTTFDYFEVALTQPWSCQSCTTAVGD